MDRVMEQWCPRRAPGMTVLRESDGLRLVGPGGRPDLRLNDTAVALWELCDGVTTVAEMVAAINVLCVGDAAAISADVVDALQRMRGLAVVA